MATAFELEKRRRSAQLAQLADGYAELATELLRIRRAAA